MKLETALQIIEEQAKYVTSMMYSDDEHFSYEKFVEDRYLNFSENGDTVNEYCSVNDWCIETYKLDKSKIYVTEELQEGGEGCGDTYTYIFKIDHPVHGKGLIRYEGYYDSWNGTTWDSCTPEMVESYEYIAIGYRPVKA